MNDTERAVMLVEAGKRAAEALSPTRDLVRAYPEVTLGTGLPVPLVRAIARVMGAPVRTHSYHSEADGCLTTIESTGIEWEGVTIHCQGSRPTGVEDLPQAPTCSECSGPLEDGMGCTARDGRCGSCIYEEGERERKAGPYRGTVRAEERAIDAGIGGRQ